MKHNSCSRNIFLVCNSFFLTGICLLIMIPLWNVLITSFAEDKDVINTYLLWPKSFTLKSYERIFKSNYFRGMALSLLVTIVGTLVAMSFTIPLAYALAQKNLRGRSVIMKMILATYILNAGLVPNYMLIKWLGLIDSLWALVMVGALSTFNLILLRNYFTSISDSLIESARLDGASEVRVLFSIVLPISKPIIAVIVLFYIVNFWNQYMDVVMYINNSKKFTIQILLRQLMFEGSDSVGIMVYDNFKMAVMVVAVLPVTMVYLAVQRHFISGIMIGAVKE